MTKDEEEAVPRERRTTLADIDFVEACRAEEAAFLGYPSSAAMYAAWEALRASCPWNSAPRPSAQVTQTLTHFLPPGAPRLPPHLDSLLVSLGFPPRERSLLCAAAHLHAVHYFSLKALSGMEPQLRALLPSTSSLLAPLANVIATTRACVDLRPLSPHSNLAEASSASARLAVLANRLREDGVDEPSVNLILAAPALIAGIRSVRVTLIELQNLARVLLDAAPLLLQHERTLAHQADQALFAIFIAEPISDTELATVRAAMSEPPASTSSLASLDTATYRLLLAHAEELRAQREPRYPAFY